MWLNDVYSRNLSNGESLGSFQQKIQANFWNCKSLLHSISIINLTIEEMGKWEFTEFKPTKISVYFWTLQD